MNLAFDVAANASRESTSFRWLIIDQCVFGVLKPSAEGSGIFKKKKTTEPVMTFSFSAEDVAGKDKKKAYGRGVARMYFRYNSQRR